MTQNGAYSADYELSSHFLNKDSEWDIIYHRFADNLFDCRQIESTLRPAAAIDFALDELQGLGVSVGFPEIA